MVPHLRMTGTYHFFVSFWRLLIERSNICLPYPELHYHCWGICDFRQRKYHSSLFFSAMSGWHLAYWRQLMSAWEIEFNFKERPTFFFFFTYAHTSHPSVLEQGHFFHEIALFHFSPINFPLALNSSKTLLIWCFISPFKFLCILQFQWDPELFNNMNHLILISLEKFLNIQ